MAKYRIKRNPATGLPIETKLYTLWQIKEFLEDEYDPDDWEEKVGERPNRRRSVILYAMRECQRNAESNRREQLKNSCNKYWTAQPPFWPRFLREKYPMARIKDFFLVPYDDVRAEFYEYESFARENNLSPDETGKVFDIKKAVEKLGAKMAEIGKAWDMAKSPIRPVVIWDDDPKMTSNPEILARHLTWLESHGVDPAVIHKSINPK